MKLDATEIKIRLMRKGVTISELAAEWEVDRENLSRVINRTKGFVFPEIRKKLADFIGVPESAIGRHPESERHAKAA
jgi:lambda repressor-like predicted transcriptional regulator